MIGIAPKEWKTDLPEFCEKTRDFYAGKMDKGSYKGFSGRYGSYAQKGGAASMLRLRMTAGCVSKEKLAFIAKAIRAYQVNMVHFTTCESVQFHNLDEKSVCELMEQALDAGIVTMGGGGDFPRNVMCSPLSGVEEGEYFDVMPWAKAAGEYLMTFINAEKMPRKLKVCFSNSPANVTHATYRDLGFAACPDGTFEVYSAGGLGNNPQFGVKVAEGVAPEKILYYIKAMWLTFRAYGNYENRGKARTRYMQEALGGAENYRKAYQEKLQEVLASGEQLDLSREEVMAAAGIKEKQSKTGDGSSASGERVLEQKQPGLYTVIWHPIGGQPRPETLAALGELMQTIDGTELRLAPDETAYIINLTGAEAEKILEATKETAQTKFETSVSCIGASICQVGARDSQALLQACVKAVGEAQIPDGALPQIHISGCPSSCGTHQTGPMGFRGGVRMADGKAQPAFVFYLGGNEVQGKETMGRELGTMFESEIPSFLVKLGKEIAAKGLDFESYRAQYPDGIEKAAEEYLN